MSSCLKLSSFLKYLFITFLAFVVYVQHFLTRFAVFNSNINLTESSSGISLGIIVCAGERNVTTKAITVEALTMIKSVIISMKLYSVSDIEFYIFTDSANLSTYFQAEVDRYVEVVSNTGKITVDLHFYSAVDALPQEFLKSFKSNSGWNICIYTRLFFPDILPESLKQVLFLDTDIIVTGNIQKIWNTFNGSVMDTSDKLKSKKPYLAGIVETMEANDTKFIKIYHDNFNRFPHVLPRGVNAGIFFMNLEALREFNWSKKCMAVFSKHSELKTKMVDQEIINYIFHFNLERLKVFTCEYNFQHLHCERGWSCSGAASDPDGIQILHGAGGVFSLPGRSHYPIYEAFRKFDISDIDDVIGKLLRPVKEFQTNVKNLSTCNGTIGPHLFSAIL